MFGFHRSNCGRAVCYKRRTRYTAHVTAVGICVRVTFELNRPFRQMTLSTPGVDRKFVECQPHWTPNVTRNQMRQTEEEGTY